MIHGHGNQYHLTRTYQELREQGLLDSDDLTTEEKTDADISFPDGGGETNSETYIIEVQDIEIKRKSAQKKTYDVRDDPRCGR